MTTRLSQEDVHRSLESGYQGFLRSSNAKALFPQTTLDLQGIISHPNSEAIIQSLPPHVLYTAMVQRGLGDCLEILPLLSQDQFQRFCDYDAWHAERLAPKRLFDWLNLYKEIAPKQMAERFRQLEEEYQLAVLNLRIRVYSSEDYEQMSNIQQDRMYSLPNNALYYEITEEDKNTIEEVKKSASKIGESIEKYRFREALGEAMNIARIGNRYLADSEPWKLVKTNPERVETIICNSTFYLFYPC